MKVIVAGSRNITDAALVERALKASGFFITQVVSGGCRGVDKIAEAWAEKKGVHIKVFEAEWGKRGRAAGPIRNMEMAKYADGEFAA